ncbi:MAG: hypothetical protein WAS73_01290 [Defluviicoccus sp.]
MAGRRQVEGECPRHQVGAVVGYNPLRPGQPSHALFAVGTPNAEDDFSFLILAIIPEPA